MSGPVKNTFRKISQALGVQWAPVDIPFSRRVQTLAVAFSICLILFGEFASIYLFIQLIYSQYWWLAMMYGVYLLNDIEICCRGGRKSEWIRDWSIWRYFCDYFPIRLVKTVDLETSQNYLFACYPHGVIATGTCASFSTNALGFYKLFPGLTVNFITLRGHFLVPFFRDWLLALGICSCSQESLLYLLDQKKGKGKCAAMMIGGAAEALDAHPGQYKIILSRRKGFVRIAIMSGASLVPVFSFGEPDVFHPMPNPTDSWLRTFQETVRKYTGISPMFPLGRGIFQYTFGVLPFRTPITTVVGAPLEVKKNLEPTQEEIDSVHAEFTKRLQQLFDSEKSKYLKNHAEAQLVIL